MSLALCAVVLAAGEGRRLRPLTAVRPKALCPVGNTALVDLTLARVAGLGLTGPAHVAVNACYLGEQVVTHVGERATVSVEPGSPLGTSGGVANLSGWIDGRAVLVGNADAYLADPATPPGKDIAALLAGWDRRSVRVLAVPAADPVRAEFGGYLTRPAGGRRPGRVTGSGGYNFAGFSLLPWDFVAALPVQPAELVRTVWRPAEDAGRLEVVVYPGTYLDTGTPGTYLDANLHTAGAGSLIAPDADVTGRIDRAVVGAGAAVRGAVTRAVVWPGGYVAPDEHLIDAVRVGRDLTVPRGTRRP